MKFTKKKQTRKKKRKNTSQLIRKRKTQLKVSLSKAGLEIDPRIVIKRIFHVTLGLVLLLNIWVLYEFSLSAGVSWKNIIYSFVGLQTIVFVAIHFILWLFFYVYLDVRTYKRKVEIEEIFPDFLQLTAANIKAGMTIDKALWFSVRPNFGVLAHEIEIVAKDTMAGEDLKVALTNFAQKYDSKVLERSIALLIEGVESGGEIGTLLTKIASNIEDQKIMLKEMAASVTTYVIFITFASIIAAPLLFSLSGALVEVLGSITSELGDSGGTGGFAISLSGPGLSESDFRTFAYVSLSITAFFSAMIVSMIRKGNVKEGLKSVPLFIMVSLSLYTISSSAALALLSSIF